MQFRPYQIDAIDRTFAAWKRARRVLGVAATGLGKTVMFASIIARHPGRAMVLAHREELIFQAADKIHRITGLEPDIEMADLRAAEISLQGKAKVIISTIQTQTAGRRGGRMRRFNPKEFSLLVVDEAHHALADSFRRVLDYYQTNPDLHVLGVTATPNRADEQALGRIFEDVAFEYDLRFGIDDGWLVRLVPRTVHVDSLDLSGVRTTAGDLNGADLARVMEYEETLLQIAAASVEITCDLAEGVIQQLIRKAAETGRTIPELLESAVDGNRRRKTLIFAASLAHAERLCEIINRYLPGSARWVHGKTPKLDRRRLFEDFAKRRFQYLVNVGVATEGFDDPGIEVVIIARPTKSTPLFIQMLGRGTRPLLGVVDDPDFFGSAAMRRQAIADSTKPFVEIVDFVGNCGRHRLVSTLDALAGQYPDDVINRAKKQLEKEPQDALQVLEAAEQELHEERERARQAEAARRAKLIAGVRYRSTFLDPFDVFGLTPWRERGWEKGKALSEKMVRLLQNQGVVTEGLSFSQAKQLIAEITSRWNSGRCSFKQAKILASRGLSTDVTHEQAREMIDAIAASEGWRSRKARRSPATTASSGIARY